MFQTIMLRKEMPRKESAIVTICVSSSSLIFSIDQKGLKIKTTLPYSLMVCKQGGNRTRICIGPEPVGSFLPDTCNTVHGS